LPASVTRIVTLIVASSHFVSLFYQCCFISAQQPKQRGKKYAQFLVVYREGSFQNTVGVWKRYSDFDALAHTVASGQYGCSECSSILSGIHPLTVDHGEREEKEVLPNALTSWYVDR